MRLEFSSFVDSLSFICNWIKEENALRESDTWFWPVQEAENTFQLFQNNTEAARLIVDKQGFTIDGNPNIAQSMQNFLVQYNG